MKHQLKILSKYFIAVTTGIKTFEVRKDDRNFQVGDYITLLEWDGKKYTNLYWVVQITYILGRKEDEKKYVADGYVILGIRTVYI